MAMVKCIEDLPDEVLVKIFSNLTIEDLAMRIQHVCWRWRNVSHDGDLWKNKTYFTDWNTTDKEILEHLKCMPSLKAFYPGRGINSKSVISTLCKTCKDIEKLDFLESQRLTPHTLKKILKSYPNLKYIGFPISKATENIKFCEILGQFNKLTTIAFTDPTTGIVIIENVLSTIAEGCPSLQHVDLGYLSFSVQDIDCFLGKKRQQLLSIRIRCYITTETLALVAGCTNLQHFEYVNCNENLTRYDMRLLSNLSNLKEVILLHFEGRALQAMPSMFANKALSQLTKLHLIFSSGTESQSLNEILCNCPNLKDFKILDNELNGGFQSISNCRKLEKLTIYSSILEDESLVNIGAGCQVLKYLDIQSCSLLTDKAIEYISNGCPKLEYLEMGGLCKLTDETFKHLFKCKNLKCLSITYNSNITGKYFDKFPINFVYLNEFYVMWCDSILREHIDNLKKQMPHLKISHDINENQYNQEECCSVPNDACFGGGESYQEESCSNVDLDDVYFVTEMK